MIKNYFQVALRNLRRHKGYSFINIAGFAVGIACCILLALYVRYELGFDRYHKNADRIFRLGVRGNQGGTQFEWGDSNAVAAQVLRNDYPEVIEVARFGSVPNSSVKHQDRLFYEDDLLYADKTVFDIFSWELLRGDPENALEAPYSIVLTETMAEKYFGTEEPMGKSLIFNSQESFTVTGIVSDVPQNSTLTFDGLCSFQTLYSQGESVSPILRNWLDFNFETYLLLQEGFDFKRLEAKFPAMLEKHAGQMMRAMGSQEEFFLQPLRDIHLRQPGDNAILYVYVFSIIALFVLLIACVNFMNLSTARSAQRAREVGLRKVLGADKKRLMTQFLGESMLYSFLAFLIALMLVQMFNPLIESLVGFGLSFGLSEIIGFIPGFLALILITGLVAGSYPALFLSTFQPVAVLKGSLKRGAAGRNLRRTLIVIQFAISIALIVGTGLIRNQLLFLKNKNLGFNKDNIVVLPLMEDDVRKSVTVIKEELQKNPRILNVAVSSILPGQTPPLNSKFPEGYKMNEYQLMSEINVGPDFVPALGIEMAAGRNFSEEFPADEAQSVLINQTAASQFGWDEPLRKVIRTFSGTGGGIATKKVVGVVKDFHLEPLSQRIRPLFMAMESAHRFIPLRYLLIKIDPQMVPETLSSIQSTWTAVFPTVAYDSFFLDESFGRQLAGMERSRDIFSSFTFLAMLIACLGLFGMSAYTAEQRTKEIGIRKVLGCSSSKVVYLLSREVMVHIVAAAVISWPLIYFLMNRWLRNFPYRADLNIWTFAFAFLLVFVIGLATVSFQAVKASLANPVKSLRYE
jgi:putative ABC transport system permease protein